MNEFLNALAITLVFVLGGYVLFGGLGTTQSETETMDMGTMEMTSGDMGSMPSMNH